MKTILRDVEVRPMFSLDPIRQYLDKEVLRNEYELHVHLQRMKKAKDWPSQRVSATKIPILMTHRKRSTISTKTEELTDMYDHHGEIPLETPYLIGCINEYPEIVWNTLQDIHSLEVIEKSDGCLVSVFGKICQLCVRRTEGRLSIVFSHFTNNHCIRADAFTSDSSVKYLTTPKIDVLREKMLKWADKMIG